MIILWRYVLLIGNIADIIYNFVHGDVFSSCRISGVIEEAFC